MGLQTSSKRDVATQCAQYESFYSNEQGFNKLSYLPLIIPTFDSMEFPQEMLMGAPDSYEGSKFPLETFILQCEIYSEIMYLIYSGFLKDLMN